MAIVDRLRRGWNAFNSEDKSKPFTEYATTLTAIAPDRYRTRFTNENSIVGSIYTRIGIDASAIEFWHVRTDDNARFDSIIESGLQECLNVEANIDQAARAFRLDMVLSLCAKGVIAIVPVDTTTDPTKTSGFDINSLRVGEIVEWYPRHVKVLVYNDRTGSKEEIVLPKASVGIVENPLASIMNAPNSILQRLIRKLYLLDMIDEQSGSGKLDIIIQLPYTIRRDRQKEQAETRRKNIEYQLTNSKYGIAYADATEKITQLNRPAENNLLAQVTRLEANLYSQLGLSEALLNGTADEQTMTNYYNRTIEPIAEAICQELNRKFLTKTARTQKQKIMFYRDPFKLVPISNIAEIADKFTRNEILTSNELRGIIGYMPVKDPKADQLINSNLSQPTEDVKPPVPEEEEPEEKAKVKLEDEELEEIKRKEDRRDEA